MLVTVLTAVFLPQAQIIASIWACFVGLGVADWQSDYPSVLHHDHDQKLTMSPSHQYRQPLHDGSGLSLTPGCCALSLTQSCASQKDKFTCASSYGVFFNSGVQVRRLMPPAFKFADVDAQWGAIGPARLYSEGKIYHRLLYGFLFGALAPIATWLIARRYPTSWWRYVSAPA